MISTYTSTAAAAPDIVNVTIGGVGTRLYSFDGNITEERLSNTFELPHDVDYDGLNAETSYIEAHVHWSPSTNNAGNVLWYLDYCYIPVNGAPIAEATITATGTTLINKQYYHYAELRKFQNLQADSSLEI